MKNIRIIVSLAVFFLLVLQNFLFAVKEDPKAIVTDQRFRVYIYQPYEVYSFTGHFLFQSIIEFDPSETIASVSLGDSTGWQVVPAENRLFLKPVDEMATTNMTVITDKRIYHFELYGKETKDIRDEEMIFVLKFVYPEQGFSAVQQIQGSKGPDLTDLSKKYNFQYELSGPEEIAPIKIFDDGEFTYFQFRNINADLPAFFSVDNAGNEAIINYRILGDYLVVERVNSRFTLRHGVDKIVCVYNQKLLNNSPSR